jgi:general stress protein 26
MSISGDDGPAPVTRAELCQFIGRHRLGVLATVSDTGAPEAAVVGVAVTDDLELVFDTLGSTRKAHNLRRDPHIAVVIGWDHEQTVQYEGLADEPAGAELERLRRRYFEQFPDGPSRLAWPGITYFRVRPTWIRYSDFRTPQAMVIELSGDELATTTGGG